MVKRRKKNDLELWQVVLVILAAFAAFAKGFSDGMKPPPGDRRG
jgi:phosphate/sulfate permease